MPKIKVNMDEIPDFQSVAPGRHRSKLTSCEEATSNAGNDMLTWEWEVIEGEQKGNTIKSYTSLLDDALGGLKNHLKAFGFSGEVDVDTKTLVGKTAIIIVVERKYRDKDTGEEKTGSQIKTVLPDGTEGKGNKPSGGASKGKAKASVSSGDIPF